MRSARDLNETGMRYGLDFNEICMTCERDLNDISLILRTLTQQRRSSKCFLQLGSSVDFLGFVKFFAMGSSVFSCRREAVLDFDCFYDLFFVLKSCLEA